MADLKSVVVEHLRQLAHAHLGRSRVPREAPPGLLGTLVRGVRGLARRMGLWPEPPPPEQAPPAAAASSDGSDTGPRPPVAPARPLPGDDDEKTPVHLPPQPVRVVNFPPKPKPTPQSSLAGGDEEVTQESPVLPPPLAEPPPSGEPLVEGFFVARVAGEGEAERHHLASPFVAAVSGPPEGPGALPRHYADDTFLLLPRDPHTLFAVWDFSDASRQRALRGLVSPRAVLRLLCEERLLAVIDVALEVRGYYLHGLPAASTYRLEAHFVGQDGTSHLIGPASNPVALPPEGPSADTSVRFLRVPPRTTQRLGAESSSALPAPRLAPVEEREYITWRRVALPGSAEALEVSERRREQAPSSPSSAAPPALRDALWVRRPEGSSEQVPGVPPPGLPPPSVPGVPGPGVPGPGAASADRGAWWFGSSGPVGSSEQAPPPPGVAAASPPGAPPPAVSSDVPPGAGAWFGSSGPVGSSEQVQSPGAPPSAAPRDVGHWYWSPGPVGSSEQGPGAPSARGEGPGAPAAWMGSSGPAGSSEQGPGGTSPSTGAGQWVWWYGPVRDGAHGGEPGRGEVSEQWVWSRGPTGSSEQWVWSFGPAGASEQSAVARPELPASRER